MRVNTLARTLSLATLVVVAATGCHWFGKDKGPYAMAPEQRPLEVPPDLDRPAVDAAMKLPPTASATTPGAPNAASATAASPIGFTVPGERDAVFAKVGDALAATEGVKIASKAQILGTYDINYAGSDFLVRVTKVEAGVYVSAVDPRGLPAAGEAPQKLMAALKAALGG
ncbi:hypothetical protein LYSHEL_23840 [Lysobacter helvus]|uniref:Beta-barrel assembly machine subunit BamC n=2 Tax=Lysobacteraceae TaxID=32033 RepID=A0ABN6FWN9_9GAMM|nr:MULTISPECIES: hypothetical protein [Lysobacter]BCT93360.1 hypothetical protein LYSCAS_23840 [Lysobacter caseinilyticus]BCT96513.1 hypothetical protein LYSHEL_23840 [Lysobacter helvus]